ncbi:MAG TPA: uracil-DNA glycosylase family protein [Chitinophagales bacterium]|nr:uracil-DNA glycosylase family protein [Chitinophagales bacterium]
MIFSNKAISFFDTLDLALPSSLNIEVLNPYQNPETKKCVKQFFTKYFNDNRKRIFILGINPGRFGGGLTGISFTDPVALRKFCGIENDFGNKRELSSEFIYLMIEEYGGVKKFYRDFFISAVCPLGFMKGSLNYNYYDDKRLQEAVTPFINKTFKDQIEIGARGDALIVIGADKNRKFVESLNNEIQFFEKIIPLEHPRFIMQYRRKKLSDYIQQYVAALQGLSGG